MVTDLRSLGVLAQAREKLRFWLVRYIGCNAHDDSFVRNSRGVSLFPLPKKVPRIRNRVPGGGKFPPVEEWGSCVSCKKRAILGEGLCVVCWDRGQWRGRS